MSRTRGFDVPTGAHVPRLISCTVRMIERRRRSSNHIRVFIICETAIAGLRLTIYISFAKASALVVPSVPEGRDATRDDRSDNVEREAIASQRPSSGGRKSHQQVESVIVIGRHCSKQWHGGQSGMVGWLTAAMPADPDT